MFETENDGDNVTHQDPEHSSGLSINWRYLGISLAGFYVAGSIVAMVMLGVQLLELRKANNAMMAQQKAMTARLQNSEMELIASTTTLGERVGLTQKELARRVAELRKHYQATEEKLLAEQEKRYSAFAGEVAGVKTDVASARTDLESTKSRLEQAIGDLGVHSGLIASTRDELQQLKLRGERNYIEFTLVKGGRPMPVSTISLQLKKTNPKRARFTMKIMADDREIEKKDRNLNEPLQFYTGRGRQLYEVVVYTIEKNRVMGYLSMPKI